MAISTTGSTVVGLNAGLKTELTGPNGPSIRYVIGNPDGIVTSSDISGLAIDSTNGNIYMASSTNGSSWFSVGSTT